MDAEDVILPLGSLYEPAAKDRFDLIISNPPFVISPGYDCEYRDNSMMGDSRCKRDKQRRY
jgi:methylase of polypeptide subunit release factors